MFYNRVYVLVLVYKKPDFSVRRVSPYPSAQNINYYPFVLFQENISLVIPWVIGFITFMALEAVSMVYSNVLRDHVNKVSILFVKKPQGCVMLHKFKEYHSLEAEAS